MIIAATAPEGINGEEKLKLSVEISDAVTGVIAGLNRKPSFLIAKGGITSSDVGTKALKVRKALAAGQVQPGIPVWKTGPESRFPGLAYIIFPGNVGETDTLKKIVELLAPASWRNKALHRMPFRQEDVRMRKVIISLAPVEAGLPVDKEALAEDVVRRRLPARPCAICTAAGRTAP
ncbi:MAG: nucleotide-binding domain containing protein [Eisenbergiella sp.]